MASAEAESIISKIKGKGKAAPAAKEPDADDEPAADAGSEAMRAACEDMLKVAFKGREPTSAETDAWVEAMDSYFTAKGY